MGAFGQAKAQTNLDAAPLQFAHPAQGVVDRRL